MNSAKMGFLHIVAYIVKAIFLCISLRKALALRETNAANNSQQSSHIIGILWDVQSIEAYFQNEGLFLSNQRWDYFTSSWNKKSWCTQKSDALNDQYLFSLLMNRHVVMILRNTNIPQYWPTHSPRHKWLDLLGITTSIVHLPPRRSFIFCFASLPNSLYEA